MGYFSNGTEGEAYQSCYCWRCKNWKEDEFGVGCPIWDAHIIHSTYGKEERHKVRRKVLDTLIPEGKVRNQQCSMFNLKSKKPELVRK